MFDPPRAGDTQKPIALQPGTLLIGSCRFSRAGLTSSSAEVDTSVGWATEKMLPHALSLRGGIPAWARKHQESAPTSQKPLRGRNVALSAHPRVCIGAKCRESSSLQDTIQTAVGCRNLRQEQYTSIYDSLSAKQGAVALKCSTF